MCVHSEAQMQNGSIASFRAAHGSGSAGPCPMALQQAHRAM